MSQPKSLLDGDGQEASVTSRHRPLGIPTPHGCSRLFQRALRNTLNNVLINMVRDVEIFVSQKSRCCHTFTQVPGGALADLACGIVWFEVVAGMGSSMTRHKLLLLHRRRCFKGKHPGPSLGGVSRHMIVTVNNKAAPDGCTVVCSVFSLGCPKQVH